MSVLDPCVPVETSFSASLIAPVRRNIPKGKTRVVGIDLFDHGDYIVGDYDDKTEAFQVADENNKARSGSMDDVYYVYNDGGELIRSHKDVSDATGDLGISP